MKTKLNTKEISQIAILGAISAILLIPNFGLLFMAPSFYKIDFADVAGLIGGFALGPIPAIYIQIIKILINILLEGGSQTMFIGELSNFLMSLAFVLPASIIYKNNRTKNGAIKALIVGSIVMTLISGPINYFLIIPAYVKFMGFPLEAIIELGSKVYPIINSKFLLVLLCTLPFNAIKALANSILTFLLYKRISSLLVKNR